MEPQTGKDPIEKGNISAAACWRPLQIESLDPPLKATTLLTLVAHSKRQFNLSTVNSSIVTFKNNIILWGGI